MAYDPRVVAAFNKAIAHTNAPPVVAKALFEAGIVESGLRNLNYGDRDSVGALQQRPSQGWSHALQPYAAALDFLGKAIPLAKSGLSSGDIAQAVQRSAFPARYAKQSKAAAALAGGGGASASGGGASSPTAAPAPTVTGAAGPLSPPTIGDPGQAGDFSGLVSSLLSRQAQPSAPSMSALPAPSFAAGPALPKAYAQLPSIAAPATPQQDPVQTGLSLVGALGGSASTVGSSGSLVAPQTGPSAPTGASASVAAPKMAATPKIVTFDGKPVAGWIAPILQRARATGLWKGTVSSGYRSDAEQTRIYNSGVRPAAIPKSEGGTGSNHEGAVFPLGAVDVSDAPGLAAALKKLGVNKLQYAGSKDPVHFSHPHNGGY